MTRPMHALIATILVLPSRVPPTFPLISLIFILPLFIFWLWMFRDMLDNDRLPGVVKEYWTLAFIFVSLLAAAYYYATEYRRRY